MEVYHIIEAESHETSAVFSAFQAEHGAVLASAGTGTEARSASSVTKR